MAKLVFKRQCNGVTFMHVTAATILHARNYNVANAAIQKRAMQLHPIAKLGNELPFDALACL